jgi:hypothetical protein
MTEKSNPQRRSGASRDQSDDGSRDITKSAKGANAAKNVQGWLRSKELQPPN